MSKRTVAEDEDAVWSMCDEITTLKARLRKITADRDVLCCAAETFRDLGDFTHLHRERDLALLEKARKAME